MSGTATTIAQAPWTAYIDVETATDGWDCTGAVLDATHVLTAGHCVVDENTGQATPAQDFRVYTGDANVGQLSGGSPYDAVTSAVADPSYDATADTYDVAVLTLATPLSWNADVQAISLGPASGAVPGATLSVSGFGLEAPPASGSSPDGSLNTLAMTVGPAGECTPTFDALVGCASAPGGATCEGDSGSALVSATTPPQLLGIVDAGAVDADNDQCEPGFTTFYAKVTAPEIADFITGLPGPYPAAPQGGAGVDCSEPSVPRAGETLSCTPGAWSNASGLGYSFIDDGSGAVLQTGSAQYALTSADVGRRIYFQVTAVERRRFGHRAHRRHSRDRAGADRDGRARTAGCHPRRAASPRRRRMPGTRRACASTPARARSTRAHA